MVKRKKIHSLDDFIAEFPSILADVDMEILEEIYELLTGRKMGFNLNYNDSVSLANKVSNILKRQLDANIAVIKAEIKKHVR